jgi:hypothetical protein
MFMQTRFFMFQIEGKDLIRSPYSLNTIRNIGKGTVVPVLNQLSTPPSRRLRSGCIDPRILDLGTS